MSDEDKTFSGSFVLDLRILWRQAHTLYTFVLYMSVNSIRALKLSAIVPRILNKKEAFISGRF